MAPLHRENYLLEDPCQGPVFECHDTEPVYALAKPAREAIRIEFYFPKSMITKEVNAMKRRKSLGALSGTLVFVLIVFVLTTAGCASYYKVSDPASGKTYYTTKIKKTKIGRDPTGTVSFKDAKTKSKVTLQSSEIKKVSGKEFREKTKE
jgi:uncharacterized protein YceK